MMVFVALLATFTASAGPPVQPSWASPLPKFPSSWFGANVKSLEVDDPKELALLKQFSQVLASWPELTVSSGWSNGTAIAVGAGIVADSNFVDDDWDEDE